MRLHKKHASIYESQWKEIGMSKQYGFKKIILVFGILLLGLSAAETLHADKAPVIKFKNDSWDFGQAKEGKRLDHTFAFTNAGQDTLKINQVHTSCGCTAALLSKKSYAPGEKGEIKVTFSTRGYEGDVSKYIYVESNDPKQPNKMLTISASIDVPPRPKIELSRYSIDLGLLLEGDKIQVETTIFNKGEKELSVTLGHRDAEFFLKGKKITKPLKIAAKKSETIDIKFPSGKRKGMLREYVLMRSNDPMRPNLSLYLSGYMVSQKQLKELFIKYKDVLKK